MYPVTVYGCPDADFKFNFSGENETTCWPPCCRTVALLVAASLRNPHGVVQMFCACPQSEEDQGRSEEDQGRPEEDHGSQESEEGLDQETMTDAA